MTANELETSRLRLRKPTRDDAQAIFERYSSDPEVTRLLAWPTHRTVADTQIFLDFSDAEWERSSVGPFLAFRKSDGLLLGSTGLAFETPVRAATGYVLARDAWGQGYATEALAAMVELAGRLGVLRLYALCHTGHPASQRVLDKCGFEREGILRRYSDFPNLEDPGPLDVTCHARILA